MLTCELGSVRSYGDIRVRFKVKNEIPAWAYCRGADNVAVRRRMRHHMQRVKSAMRGFHESPAQTG